MKKKLLIIDDEPNLRRAIKYSLSKKIFDIKEAENGKKALKIMEEEKPDIIITDIKMPVMDGITFLKELKKQSLDIPTIVLTAFGNVEIAVSAMKNGAIDFLVKPFPITELEAKISSILSKESKKNIPDFIGESESILKVKKLCEKFAKAPHPILITGPSGSGKEVIARYIHSISKNRDKFIAINCGALPENLLESELFGYKKGAFTGANKDSPGFFKIANNGTLFLDEIGEISHKTQVSLLRVIQEGEFYPVGSTQKETTNARIIAATNKDLKKEVETGNFREDLYYRLNVLEIKVPSLYERRDDIILLANYFLESLKSKFNLNIKGFSNDAINFLKDYKFPGNVRELKNMIERAIWVCEDDFIKAADLGAMNMQTFINESNNNERIGFKKQIEQFEKDLILEAIKKYGNNKSKLAQKLGITRTALIYKMKKYKLMEE